MFLGGLDSSTGALAGVVTALLVVLGALALNRVDRDGIVNGVACVALVLVGAVLTLFLVGGTGRHDSAAERRALEARAGVLATRATMPGSPLACLDAMAGDAVERSCDRTLFATPEAAAAAVSYVATQLDLFADVSNFVKRGNAELEPLLASLRRAIEIDRYGLVAHVLATRDGCTIEQCPTLALMRDTQRLNANLKQHTYDFYVARYSSAWPASGGAPMANVDPSAIPNIPSTSSPPQAASAVATPTSSRPSAELFFPTSETIPPVNIMTAEPETTGSTPARAERKRPARKDQPKQTKAPVDIRAAGAPPADQ